ncbi:hypothetical protein BDW74DRAFT_100936 [Aspergillus multicolor]|uniref:uncharacterized protein n=1 Tax=Aspergillus multicolor TaxID=41759 RepID=UPI003CCCB0EE
MVAVTCSSVSPPTLSTSTQRLAPLLIAIASILPLRAPQSIFSALPVICPIPYERLLGDTGGRLQGWCNAKTSGCLTKGQSHKAWSIYDTWQRFSSFSLLSAVSEPGEALSLVAVGEKEIRQAKHDLTRW